MFGVINGEASLNNYLIAGRRDDNVGPGGRRLGPGVRRGVRAGGRGELHAVRGEDEDGAGHRRGAPAQRLHGEGGRQDGAVHRQLRLPEAEGRRVPVLCAQAVGLVLDVPVVVAGGGDWGFVVALLEGRS